MKRILLTCLLCLLGLSVLRAQEAEPPSSLMERGAQQFLEGLLQEMEPALEGLMSFINEMGPAMQDILDEVKDWSVYQAPEVLPNGDIIIRRKPDVPEPEPEGLPQIEL
jgi:hypothetical protein